MTEPDDRDPDLTAGSRHALPMTIASVAARLSEDATAATITGDALRAAHATRERTNAVLLVDDEGASRAAGALDALPADGAALPLRAVPIVLGDDLLLAGVPATAGSETLDGFVPPYTAAAVRRVQDAGGVIVAKANMAEFGLNEGLNEGQGYGQGGAPEAGRDAWRRGPVLNPTSSAPMRSGNAGAAVAVREGVSPVALGGDLGGSLLGAAAELGLVGFRPSHGAVSKAGLVTRAGSLTEVAVVATNVEDALTTWRVLSGAPAEAPNAPAGGAVTLGLVSEPQEGDDAREGAAALRAALEALGFTVAQVNLPLLAVAGESHAVIAAAEASSDLARYGAPTFGRRVGEDALGQEAVLARTRGALFGPGIKLEVLLGTELLAAGDNHELYERATHVRQAVTDSLREALGGVDAIVTRSSANASQAGRTDAAFALAGLAGLPTVTVPLGATGDGPRLHLVGGHGEDEQLLALAGSLCYASSA